MPLQRHAVEFETLSPETLDAWRGIPPAIVSDCMNRTHFMAAAIKPLNPGTILVGQARTVTGMVGDNGISHAAIALIERGEILVIDAGGYEDVAIWGAIMTRAAMARGIAGVVIDGANRDAAEIRELEFPCYSRAQVPSGPHKGFGGIIDGPISCGGCPVRPGDLIVGDDDGIAVVPLEWVDKMLTASLEKLRQEEDIIKQIAEGKTTAELLGVGEVEVIEG
ncbi:MAG: RraA family protein [Rhodospirillales bacterium]|nr:RraA family protein [Alphaproteobacteria bacterium]MBL6948810.1 RraA family protein [Rhodospirillales bacterium]